MVISWEKDACVTGYIMWWVMERIVGSEVTPRPVGLVGLNKVEAIDPALEGMGLYQFWPELRETPVSPLVSRSNRI